MRDMSLVEGNDTQSELVADLLDILDLERLELDLFRGENLDVNSFRVFGGQVIAQALMAAYRTVEGRHCHSLHAYFIRPGDPKIPIIFQVDRARDGRSFTTRRVTAIQHGEQIFNLAASFHVPEDGWEHQDTMPDVPAPDTLMTQQERRFQIKDLVPEVFRPDFAAPRPIELREVNPLDLLNPVPAEPIQHQWFRVARKVTLDDQATHHCLLAYASDMSLLGTGQRPHGVTWVKRELMSASLDHAMWFHAPMRADDWLLYAQDSPWAGGARSFNRGKIFTQAGQLICSCTQEGLFRPLKKKPDAQS